MKQYKYLGITFNETMKANQYLQILQKELNYITTKLVYLSIPLKLKIEIWKIMWNSIALYSSEVLLLRKQNFNNLEVLMRKSLKRICNPPQQTKNNLLHIYTNTLPLKDYALIRLKEIRFFLLRIRVHLISKYNIF